MADGSLDAVTLAIPALELRFLLALRFGDQYFRRTFIVVTTITAIDVNLTADLLAHESLHLLELDVPHVPIIGFLSQCQLPHHQLFLDCLYMRTFISEL